MRPAPASATLDRMSLDPTLLVRRWPERRPVVLAAAAVGSIAVLVAMGAADDPALGALLVLPTMLAALELGLTGGLAAAAAAAALIVANGTVAPAVAAFAAAAIAGRFSDRMRSAHVREQRLLDSALALGAVTTHDELPRAIAAAALRTPRVTGAEVRLAGAPSAAAGRMAGAREKVEIVARATHLGESWSPVARRSRSRIAVRSSCSPSKPDWQRTISSCSRESARRRRSRPSCGRHATSCSSSALDSAGCSTRRRTTAGARRRRCTRSSRRRSRRCCSACGCSAAKTTARPADRLTSSTRRSSACSTTCGISPGS